MGDYDTMTIAFLLDTALYYFAAIMPIYRWSHDRLGVPPFFEDGAEIGYYPIRFYNRRLVAIAQRKMALGIYGNHNAGRRPKFVGFSVRSAMWVMLVHGLLRWWKAELANAWTYVVKPRPIGKPVEASAAAPAARRLGTVAPQLPTRSCRRGGPAAARSTRGRAAGEAPPLRLLAIVPACRPRSSPAPRAASGSSSRPCSRRTATTSCSSRAGATGSRARPRA